MRLVEITDRDPITRGYDRMGWQWSLANIASEVHARRLGWVAGKALAIGLRRWSGPPMSGSAYTAAFTRGG